MFKSVVDYLFRTVKNYPDKIACEDDDASCTYLELWNGSELVAKNIIRYFDSAYPVPVFMVKSCDALKIMWGIIRAGYTYCFIDATLPKDRIINILSTLEANKVIYKQGVHIDSLLSTMDEVESIDYRDLLVDNKSFFSPMHIYYQTPLYIMFTSGTTGVPKGVVVSHGSVASFIEEFVEKFKLTSEDIIGNQAPWDFDVSVKDIFSASFTGATLFLISRKHFSFPKSLLSIICQKKISVLTWAVSALCILSSSKVMDDITIDHVRKVIFSGEVMPIRQLAIMKKSFINAEFINVYGPTEITCNCTYHLVEDSDFEGDSVPIGKPFDGAKVFLLDSKEQVISSRDIKKRGEICVSGNRLALGYFNNIVESEKVFIQNPRNSRYRELIYRTGDVAYYNSRGDLVYAGRLDNQVKYLGHRIELTEVENAIESIDGIDQAVCLFLKDKIVSVYSGDCEEESIRGKLKEKLPAFMIPTSFFRTEKFPYNTHGKIDRKALKLCYER